MICHIEMWVPLTQPMDLAWASSVLGVSHERLLSRQVSRRDSEIGKQCSDHGHCGLRVQFRRPGHNFGSRMTLRHDANCVGREGVCGQPRPRDVANL
jgi:hypothetical protein